jgi:hypothetical protein
MRLDSSGRLGLGTSTPGDRVDVAASNYAGVTLKCGTTAHRPTLSFFNTADSLAAYIQASGNSLVFGSMATDYGGHSPRMTLTGTGLGIGTTSPSATLQLGNSVGSAGAAGHIRLYESGSAIFGFGISSGQLDYRSDAHVFYTSAASPSERARIDSSGRLLVGTSSSYGIGSGAEAKLQASDTTSNIHASFTDWSTANSGGIIVLGKAKGGSAGNYTIVANGDILGEIRFAGADGTDLQTNGALIRAEVDGTPGSNDMPGRLVFSTTADGASSPTERMRIGQSGFTKISNSGTYNDAAGQYHEIMTNVTSNHALLVRAPASYASANIKSFVLTAAGSGYNHFVADANGTNVCVIRGDGNLLNTNNSYTGLSDSKLKENIVDANSQWNDLKALQVRNYNFREKTGQQTHTQIGLIAQEVELISPGLVIESPDRDADGNDLGTTTKAVQYSVLYMKAVKALQEAMERIEALEAKVAALEGA